MSSNNKGSMSYYVFDEKNFDSFDAARLSLEPYKVDSGPFRTSYFSVKYQDNDNEYRSIKIKTPVLTTPFGINFNQFDKLTCTLSVPEGKFHTFLERLQETLKQLICKNVQKYNPNYKSKTMSENEFDILSVAFGMLRSREDKKYDDTISFDITSPYTQKFLTLFDSKAKRIPDVTFTPTDETFIGRHVPMRTELRASFIISSVCMYGEVKQRKYTIKKELRQIFIVSQPNNNNNCDFEPVDEEIEEDDENGFCDF